MGQEQAGEPNMSQVGKKSLTQFTESVVSFMVVLLAALFALVP